MTNTNGANDIIQPRKDTNFSIDNIVSNGVKDAGNRPLSEVQPEHKSPLELLEDCRIRITDEYELPPAAISIITEGKPVVFGTLGDFSLITGKAKSKKTFAVSMLLAVCEAGGILQDKFRCDLPDNKRRILWFDTEQSTYHVWKVLKRISTLAGKKLPEHINVFGLRGLAPGERRTVIEAALYEGNLNNDVGLVIIDGARDLINDINDPTDATMIATKLMQWTSKAYCHIVTVLHQNKADNNARGHVGAELVNKAQTVISIERDKAEKNISLVKAEDCRDIDFTPFAFKINEDGLPEILEDYEMKGVGEKKPQFNPYNIPQEKHYSILGKVFSKSEWLGYKEIKEGLKDAFFELNENISDSKLQTLFTYYSRTTGWLTHNGQPGGKNSKHSFTPKDISK